MASGTIQNSYAPTTATITTPTSAGLSTNSSTIKRQGNLVLLYVNVRKTSGFTSETYTTIHTVSPAPKQEIAATTYWGSAASVFVKTNGDVQIYAHSAAYTGFARFVIPYFV